MIITLLTLGIFFTQCSKNPAEPTLPQDYKPSENSLQMLSNFRLVDYDRIQLYPNPETPIYDSIIKTVYLGQGQGTHFKTWESAEVTYRKDRNNKIYPVFQIEHAYDPKFSPTADLTIRYQLINNVMVDIDTSVVLYTYPYSSTKIFYTFKYIFPPIWEDERVQDFVLRDNILYVHPYGPWGISERNLANKEFTMNVVNYPSGDYITQDSVYIFYETSSYVIYRYNIECDTTLQLYSLQGVDDTYWITGLTTYQGYLYAFLLGDNVQNKFLKFTYDGTLVETIPFSPDISEIAQYNGYLFAYGGSGTLLILDMQTLQLKAAVPAPTKYMDGFDIYDDYFYYADYWHGMIGKVPLDVLFDQ